MREDYDEDEHKEDEEDDEGKRRRRRQRQLRQKRQKCGTRTMNDEGRDDDDKWYNHYPTNSSWCDSGYTTYQN